VTQRASAPPTAPPQIILVGDFDLGATTLKTDPGLVNSITRARPRLIHIGEPADPQKRIAYLGDLLADEMVKDLRAKGLEAQRSNASANPSGRAWLVAGALLSVDEGNRRRRAILGFGAGASKADLHVAITDLSRGDQQPFEDLSVDARSGQMPGTVVTLRPGVAAASYAINGDASSKDIKKAATEIADDIDAVVKESRAGKAR
jgi:hypothetical protein